MGTEGRRQGLLTCSHSTARSGRGRIRMSSLEGCWGSAHRLPHACRGSGDMRPHTFSQSTLWGQSWRYLYINAPPAPHFPQQKVPTTQQKGAEALPPGHRRQTRKTRRTTCPGQGSVGCRGVGPGHSRHMGKRSYQSITSVLPPPTKSKGEQRMRGF